MLTNTCTELLSVLERSLTTPVSLDLLKWESRLWGGDTLQPCSHQLRCPISQMGRLPSPKPWCVLSLDLQDRHVYKIHWGLLTGNQRMGVFPLEVLLLQLLQNSHLYLYPSFHLLRRTQWQRCLILHSCLPDLGQYALSGRWKPNSASCWAPHKRSQHPVPPGITRSWSQYFTVSIPPQVFLAIHLNPSLNCSNIWRMWHKSLILSLSFIH